MLFHIPYRPQVHPLGDRIRYLEWDGHPHDCYHFVRHVRGANELVQSSLLGSHSRWSYRPEHWRGRSLTSRPLWLALDWSPGGGIGLRVRP